MDDQTPSRADDGGAALEWWRQIAEERAGKVFQLRENTGLLLAAMDKQHPEWLAAQLAAGSDFLAQDARRAFLVGVQVILQNAFFAHLFVRDQMSNPQWWDRVGVRDQATMLDCLKEWNLHLRFGVVYEVATSVEEALRSIFRAGTGSVFSGKMSPAAEFESLYKHILSIANQESLEPSFKLLRLMRNCIHTNGIFAPKDSRDDSVTIESRTFEFKVGRPMDWDNDYFIFWLPGHLAIQMVQLVTSPVIAGLAHCPRWSK